MDPIASHMNFFSVESCYVAIYEERISVEKFYRSGTVGFELTDAYLKIYAEHGHDVKTGKPVQIETYQYTSCVEAYQKWKELNDKMEWADIKEFSE